MPIQVAQEKLQADIYERVNTCNMLLHQVRQRRQVREELQRRLQQLQDAAMPDKRQQAQAQAIRQLEKNIEKMLLKVHTGQKVTALYLAVRDVLRKELAHLPPHLDLLCKMAELYGRELQDMDLMALEACKAADRAKKDANRTRSRILAERARMYRSRATQEVSADTGWREEMYQRHLRAQERHELTVDSPTPASQDQLVGECLAGCRGVGRGHSRRHPSLTLPSHPRHQSGGPQVPDGARGQGHAEVGAGQGCAAVLQHLGNVNPPSGKTHGCSGPGELRALCLPCCIVGFSALLCLGRPPEAAQVLALSPGQDIPGRLLEQQKSSADLEQCIKEGEEKKQALAERLHELELNLAKLKFHPPSNTSRVLEEELRLKLQCQEARLEDMRAQMMRSKDDLLKCEVNIDSLFVRLQGITVPGQEDPVKAMAVEEKLQHCEQKLRYLVQQVASLPHDWRSPNKDNKIFAKVRSITEKTTRDHPQNLRVSLEDADSSQGRRAQRGHVPQQPSQPLPMGIPGHPCLSSTVPAEPNPRAACPRCCGTRRESLGFKITWLWPPPVGCSWGRPRAFGSSLLCFEQSGSCTHHPPAPGLSGKPQQC
ncbi:coiled-coil domain-containing protein 183-like [Falco naumanni]|uniref:coiled-coil domain-containing protein 183-like n=1 Tax=Falco naumanni TaxID=148594 RepID=UPI001ADE3913|nr:coiled-coil domain-containing protein 183-like [Falco naumanni]